MSKCPLCHTPISDDFGLTECPNADCGAQLIVHMDGRVEYQGAHEAEALYSDTAARAEAYEKSVSKLYPDDVAREVDLDLFDAPDAGEATQMKTRVTSRTPHPDNDDLVPPEPSGAAYRMPEDDVPPAYTDEGKEFLGEAVEHDAYAIEQAQALVTSEPEDDRTIATGPAETPADEFSPEFSPDIGADADFDFDAADSGGGGGAVYGARPPVSDSPNMSDIANFGNSDMSGGREGPLRYTLFIDGIDSKDVRTSLREALTDARLQWDTTQILRSIREGKLVIDKVSPTKAYILITRLRGMPVQVRWEQNAVSQL